MERRLAITFGIVLVLIGLFTYIRQQRQNNTFPPSFKIDSGTFYIMGTNARIKLWAETQLTGKKILIQAINEIRRLDNIFSTYKEDSEISKINRLAYTQPVEISPDMHFVVQQAIKFSKLTEGAFDITIVPLIELWKTCAKEKQLPTEEEIKKAKSLVNYKHIILAKGPPPTIRFTQEGTKITLNAIAKGYIVDRVLTICKAIGIHAAIVDIGGEIACFGREFNIGIQDPFIENSQSNPEPRWLIKLKNLSVATSGNYRRFFTIKGKHYSHIIDPRTGRPADTLSSVTVIAPTTTSADALATAISVMGIVKGIELVNNLPKTEVFIIKGTKDRFNIYMTEGFKPYLITPIR